MIDKGIEQEDALVFDDTAGAVDLEQQNKSLFDDTAGAISDTTRKFGERFGFVRPKAVQNIKKTFEEDIIPGSETVVKREIWVDKAKIQPYIDVRKVFPVNNPTMQSKINTWVGFRTKDSSPDGGYIKFPEGASYNDKLDRMNMFGATEYVAMTKAGSEKTFSVPYELELQKLIEKPEGYSPPSADAILKKMAVSSYLGPDATAFEGEEVEGDGRFWSWIPFIGGEKVGVTLDKTFGTNFDETGFNIALAKQYNKILIKAGLNSRQRFGIISERLENKMKNIENIVGYARRGGRFALETGGYLIGESFDLLSDSTIGLTDSKKRNDFYDLIFDKQANILQDGYAAMGIEIDIGTAELLASMFTSTPQRLAAVAGEILIPSKLALEITKKLGAREFRKFQKYYNREAYKAGKKIVNGKKVEKLTVDEALKSFQQMRNKQIFSGKLTTSVEGLGQTVSGVYGRIDSILNGGRIVQGLQIDEAAKKVTQRPEVIAAVKTRQNIMKQKRELEDKLQEQGFISFDNEQLMKKLNNQLDMANTNLRSSILNSNLPRFLQDAARGNKYMIIGSAGFGQLAQEAEPFGADPLLFEAIGLFSGIIYDTSTNNRVLSSLLKKAYSFTTAGKKSQDLDIARELAKRVNTFSPEFRASLEKRIQHLDNVRMNLIANAPDKAKMEQLTKLSFAKLSGIAILQTLEESTRLNIAEKGVASFGETIEQLDQMQKTKQTLLSELAALSQDLSITRKANPDEISLLTFQKTLDMALKNGRTQNTKLAQDIQQLKEAQANEITDFISGTTGRFDDVLSTADISTKLNQTYKANIKNINWKNEVSIQETNKTIQDTVNVAIQEKAKSINRYELLQNAKKESKVPDTIKGKGDPEYNNFGDLFLSFTENGRNKADADVSAVFTQLDSSKFVDETGALIGTNAKTEGMPIVSKLIEVIGDSNDTIAIKDFAGGNIQGGKRATLFKGLDGAAQETLQKHFDDGIIGDGFKNLDEYVNSITLTDATAKKFLPKYLRAIEVINKDMASRGLAIDSLPLSFDQAKELRSATSNLQNKYKRMAETGNNPEAAKIAESYRQLRGESENLFDNFRVNFGEQDSRPISNMFVEIDGQIVPVKTVLEKGNKMHQTYMSRFFDNKKNWSKLFKGRNKVSPSDTRVTGITLDNNPNTWFNFDEIGTFKTQDDVDNFQKDFFELVGVEKDGKYTIDLSTQHGKTLKALMELKMADYILDLANRGDLNQKEYTQRLLNIQKAFRVATIKGDGFVIKKSLIDVEKIEKDLFGYNPLSVGDELWKTGQRNLRTRMENLAKEKVITPATDFLDQRDQVLRVLQGLSPETTGDKILAQRMFDSGPKLEKVKEGILTFYGNKLTKEKLDTMVTDVFLEDLDKNVFKPTGRKILDFEGNLIDEVDMDVELLKDIIGTGDNAKREVVKGIIGEKRLKVFEDMVAFVAEESAMAQQKANVTGIPRNFSVESYISRFYSINRGVISARYVGTEAVLQQFRLRGHSLFRALITNPEAGTLFMEIVKTGQPLSRQKEIQFFNVLTQILSNQDKLFGTKPATEINLRSGWKLKYKEYSQDVMGGDLGE